MIGLDTNILLRYFIGDDPNQLERAARVIEQALDDSETMLVSDVVLCEFAWVLRKGYKHSRAEVRRMLELLRRATGLQFEDSSRFNRALEAVRNGQGDFSDYLIKETYVEAGCRAVITFDKV